MQKEILSFINFQYMNDVLHLSIRDIGYFNSLPWILKTVTSYVFGYLIDRSIARRHIGITNARKLAVVLGKNHCLVFETPFSHGLILLFVHFIAASVLPAIFIMLASYAECAHVLVVISFTIAIGMHGFMTAGLNTNSMDLCPNYSSALMSVANGAASLTGILAPYTVGLLTPNVSALTSIFLLSFIRENVY